MNDDEIEQRLSAAGRRARNRRPDSAAAHQAYGARRRAVPERAAPQRNWLPALIGVGLVAAAAIVVGASGIFGRTETVVSPVDTPATGVTTPSTDGPDAVLAPETGTASPVTTVPPAEPTSTEPCATGIEAADDSELIIVNCRSGDDADAALIAEVPTGEALAAATRWFVDYKPFSDEPVELFFPAVVDGVDDTVSFVREFDSGLNCIALVEHRIGGEWKEQCWLEPVATQVVTDWDGRAVQFDLTNPRSVVAHPLDEVAWASSGCTRSDVGELTAQAGLAGSLYSAVGCVGDRAALREESTFMQPGRPDGSISLFERTEGGWQLVDSGTGLDTDIAFSIPVNEVWTSWTSNESSPTTYDFSSINDMAVEERSDPSSLAVLAADLIFERTGVRLNGFTSSSLPGDTLLQIWVPAVDDPGTIAAWHFIHYAGNIDDGYKIVGWFEADA